ncbi:PKC-alpha-beta-gamma [Oopsacas minuta]|uniref:Protein kinase C n=1 Tax=Oopsacas minuta TaxID=111878 RepID=A0A2P1GIV0_9METZ|nr:PKC-alpha-beta-gamma [Oopsacas minuta]KAI6652677.1 PKC-alpha-beta-gamma [Oopsacas minuta]
MAEKFIRALSMSDTSFSLDDRRQKHIAIREKKRVQKRNHLFELHFFKQPTYCAHCHQFIYGCGKQGFHCLRCSYAIHRHCVELVAFKCPKFEMESEHPDVKQHDFRITNYSKFTFCDHCGQMLYGLYKQGYQCQGKVCGMNVHSYCREFVANLCGTGSNEKYGQLMLNFLCHIDTETKGSIYVDIKSGKNLMAADSNGLSDPYCKIKLKDSKGKTTIKHQTKVHKKTLNPTFDESFEIPFNPSVDGRLEIWMWDYDNALQSDNIGGMSFSIEELKTLKTGEDIWYALINPSSAKFMNQRSLSEADEGERERIVKEIETIREKNRSRFEKSEHKMKRSFSNLNTLSVDDFDRIELLGRGAFGKVVMVEYKRIPDKIFAMKIMHKDLIFEYDAVDCTMIEQRILAMEEKPSFMTSLKASFQDEENLYMVMEFLCGGDLLFHLIQNTNFSEARSKLYIAEISFGIFYLHKQGIVFRDLKPDNVLLDIEGHVKLADFGLCKESIYHGKSNTTSFCGTIDYMAPEIVARKPYDTAVDIWSMGVLLYEMLVGRPPFIGRTDDAIIKNLLTKNPTFPTYLSPNAINLITQLLKKAPTERLGVDSKSGEAGFRGHAYFSNLDWSKAEKREIQPSFVPKITSKRSDAYFDAEYTKASTKITKINPGNILVIDQEVFNGFEFTSEEILIKS